jgi:hypothetical protein
MVHRIFFQGKKYNDIFNDVIMLWNCKKKKRFFIHAFFFSFTVPDHMFVSNSNKDWNQAENWQTRLNTRDIVFDDKDLKQKT